MEYYVFDEQDVIDLYMSNEDLSQDAQVGDVVDVSVHNGESFYAGRLVDRCDGYIFIEDCGTEVAVRTAHITSFRTTNM